MSRAVAGTMLAKANPTPGSRPRKISRARESLVAAAAQPPAASERRPTAMTRAGGTRVDTRAASGWQMP
ncbi:MAG: hypothetical protein NVS1B1_04410 [Candidatus Limnocylindrales bacterium]